MIEFSDNCRGALIDVANAIGFDLPEDITPDEVAECCIDANRLAMIGNNQAAEDEVMALLDVHRYDDVLKAIAEFIPTL